MRISLVIPTLRIGDKLDNALSSLDGEYDELIIIDDKIDNLAKKINKGLEKATGDYIIVSNDDIELISGNLHNLCSKNLVQSPILEKGMLKTFHAHMWGMSKEVYKKTVGPFKKYSDYNKPGYYEGFDKFYYDDSDYWMKLRTAGYEPIVNNNVIIKHDHPGFTLSTFSRNEESQKINKDVFVKRWGEEALNTI